MPNFSQLQSKTQHGMTQMGHQELVAHETSLIGSIWRTWSGSAATDKVSWLEMPSILGWIEVTDAKLFPAAVQNTAWHDTDGPPGAGFAFKHHSLDPYGGNGMVQQQLIRCHGWKCHQFWV
jgi:hypothetical protein